MYYYAFVSLLKPSMNDSETYLITTHCKVVPLKAVIHNIDIVIAVENTFTITLLLH